MLYVKPQDVRTNRIADSFANRQESSISGDPTKATAEFGRIGIEFKVNGALAQYRRLEGASDIRRGRGPTQGRAPRQPVSQSLLRALAGPRPTMTTLLRCIDTRRRVIAQRRGRSASRRSVPSAHWRCCARCAVPVPEGLDAKSWSLLIAVPGVTGGSHPAAGADRRRVPDGAGVGVLGGVLTPESGARRLLEQHPLADRHRLHVRAGVREDEPRATHRAADHPANRDELTASRLRAVVDRSRAGAGHRVEHRPRRRHRVSDRGQPRPASSDRIRDRPRHASARSCCSPRIRRTS